MPRPLILPLLLSTSLAARTHAADPALHQRAVEDSLHPLHPTTPWNANAKQFIIAPTFDVPTNPNATAYRFTLTREPSNQSLSFESTTPTASLAPVWNELPPGPTRLTIQPLDHGTPVGAPIERRFHRAAVFNGPYESPVLPYADSARLAIDRLLAEPFVQSWRTTGQPDPAYPLYRYASKLCSAVMSASAMYASRSPRPDDADAALAIGRRAADYLLSISAPSDAPLACFPPTYHAAKPTERENDGWTMLMSPAEAGNGYLDLYDATRDDRYLAAARHIADTYATTQRPSGTWPLKVDNTTCQPIAAIDLIPSVVINFLDRLASRYDTPSCRPTLDRAVRWILQNPARTFDWKGQFDDAKLRGPYQNLAKHEACEFAIYLFRHASESPEYAPLATELLRYAEDQFTTWESPPNLAARGENLKPEHWFTPCSAEQYAMFEPISGSSAIMITAYLAAYRATGDVLHLAKAESLANALTLAQEHHAGRYPTRMIRKDLAHWLNSTVNTARAMDLLARERAPDRPPATGSERSGPHNEKHSQP